jgi:hypothetical protein
VIPRLNTRTSPLPRSPAWPESKGTQSPPLFIGRSPLRKLVVLLDVDVVAGVDTDGWGKKWLLTSLLALELIDCLRYSSTGPPDDAARVRDTRVGEWVVGWAVLGEEDKTYRHWPLRWSVSDQSVTDGAILGNAPDVAAADDDTAAYSEFDLRTAAECRRSDVIAALVAEAVGADLFITDRPYLYEARWSLTPGVTFCRLDGALALVGLYQRAQGSFVISASLDGRGRYTMNRGLYYWVGTRELLPAGWRWFSACVQHATGSGDRSLIFLAQTVLQRVQRALQVRDAVHIALNKPQNNDTADEALAALDVTLLLLMGALDATARVLHRAVKLEGKPSTAGWQFARWRKKVAHAAPAAAELFDGPTDHHHALTILRQLRNSIHGDALSALSVSRARHRERTLAGLRVADHAKLVSAVEALGGASAWGIEEAMAGELHADPGILLEQLLPRILAVLNAILDATPVERLAHVNLRPSDLGPPVSPERGGLPGSFDEINRQSIRWQLGL